MQGILEIAMQLVVKMDNCNKGVAGCVVVDTYMLHHPVLFCATWIGHHARINLLKECRIDVSLIKGERCVPTFHLIVRYIQCNNENA